MYGLAADTVPSVVSALMQKTDLTYCVVTLGPRGVFAASGGGEMVYLPTYHVDVVDTCGSGDAFTAGFIHTVLRGGSMQEACRYGNALGALVAGQNGATQPVAPEQIEALMAAGRPDQVEPTLVEYNAWES